MTAASFSRKPCYLRLLWAATVCLPALAQQPPTTVPEIRPGYLMGYIQHQQLPDSLALLPPPPATGSAAFALDQEVAKQQLTLRDSERWVQATLDADLSFPTAANTFSCALNAPVSTELTPKLYTLLRRTLTDAGLSTYKAKEHYQRTRPFMTNQQPLCTPQEKAALEKDGSYPSGHTTIGWAWALVLAEIAPEQADAILARGLTFGASRNVCNVHWHSDVVQGRVIAAATVARMHAEPQFKADIEAAKAELSAVRAKQLKPARDCTAEAKALAQK